jgi:mannose-6-phosphate isomerase-like protein (cupin superfamily)
MIIVTYYYEEGVSMSKHIKQQDCGANPYAINISNAAVCNNNFRTTIWTGTHLQTTLMCIEPGGDIGLECHSDTDQFIRIECGRGMACMGPKEDVLNFQRPICTGCAVFVPAGTFHNIINTGKGPLKLYSIYAPPHHPRGTVHKTKKQALEEGD